MTETLAERADRLTALATSEYWRGNERQSHMYHALAGAARRLSWTDKRETETQKENDDGRKGT